MVLAGNGMRSLEWWPVGSARRGARCVINPTDSKARFPALSKLAFSSDARGHTATYVCSRACEENALLYAVWMGFTAPYIAIHWCTWTYGDANRRTVYQRPVCVDIQRPGADWGKKSYWEYAVSGALQSPPLPSVSFSSVDAVRKVRNMPLIWRMSDYATNSSHVTDLISSTLLSLCYMRCVVCCWKSRLTPAVLYWKARWAASCRAFPRVSRPNARHVGPLFGASVYSCSL